jgi:5-methylcytosine-specific restriction endonuclease McrA
MGLSECQVCSKALDKNIGMGRPKRNCSNKCRIEARARTLRARNARNLNCDYCSKQFIGNKQQARFCSKDCRAAQNLIESKAKYQKKRQELYPGGIRTTPCGWCKEPRTWKVGESVIQAFHPDCTLDAQRARYRIKTVKRQKVVNPSRLSADRVLQTYGADCSICGQTINLDIPRTSKMGLTVDHLVPLSRGGSDDIENLRPAHWICNIKKSNKLPQEQNA